MKQLSELCDSVNEQCDPAQSGVSVYVGLEHIPAAAFSLGAVGSPADVHSAKSRFRRGDILYGKLRPYLDKAVLAPSDGICSTDILVLRPKPGTCAAYLLGLIHSEAFLAQAVSTTNGVNHPRTSWAGVSGFAWHVPPMPIQEKVGAVLWKVQRAIQVEDKLIAAVQELKHAAMHQLFTHGLRGEPQKDTEIGQLPESWRVQPLAELREFLQYGTSAKCDYDRGGNPVLRIPNVTNGRIDCTDLKRCTLDERDVEKWSLTPGDVLFIRTNGVRERVGACAVYQSQPGEALFASYLIRARLRSDALDSSFFQWYTSTAAGTAQLSGRASPAADGKFNINTTTLDTLLVPLPRLDEQIEIAAILDVIDKKLSVHERKRAVLQDLFKTLLRELMTGRIRVTNLDIDVSEVTAA